MMALQKKRWIPAYAGMSAVCFVAKRLPRYVNALKVMIV